MKIRFSTKMFLFMAFCFLSFLTGSAANDHDWANHDRYQAANATLSQSPKVVFMGNSITDFWPQRSPEFWAEHPDFCGRGISGQTSSQMLCRFRQDVLDLKPEVVVILAGTNDIAQNMGYITNEHVLDNIKSMADLARHAGLKVAICSVLPCKNFKWKPELDPVESIRQLNATIEAYVHELADRNVCYVDYYTAMADADGGLPECFSADGCHPNLEGYRVMEPIVLAALAPWLRP